MAKYRSLTEIGGTDFTPDGRAIVYAGLVDRHQQLFSIGLNEGAKPKQLTDGDDEVYAPQVSPNGKLVALTVYTHTKTVRSMRLPR